MKIGIALTTHNRPETFQKSYQEIKKYAPKGAVIVVVDDASEIPVKEATYRFEENVGIAVAKNKCIELLMEMECDHLFLFDDDCHPIAYNWHVPYIESNVKHLSFTFHKLVNGRENDRFKIGEIGGLTEYKKPCGCMLYIHKDVIYKIGGFDNDYAGYGMEHVDFSNRCYNAGLTPKKVLDVSGSTDLLYSMDYHHNVISSIPSKSRTELLNANRDRYEKNIESSAYKPFKYKSGGVVLASYFNSNPDPQRQIKWESSIEPLLPFINSCLMQGVEFRIFHDCLNVVGENFIKVDPQNNQSPNAFRWIAYFDWLKENRYDNVFMVDSTDVEVLKNPFKALNPNSIYVGNEYNMKVDNNWMRNTQEPLLNIPDYRQVIEANKDETLINCGIVGGSYKMAMKYLEKRSYLHNKYTDGVLKSTDMAVFNYIMWSYFKENMVSGVKVNTKFKVFEKNNISWFRHK